MITSGTSSSIPVCRISFFLTVALLIELKPLHALAPAGDDAAAAAPAEAAAEGKFYSII